MRAVFIEQFGEPAALQIRDVADARKPRAGEVTVKIVAVGLNRADLLQVRGLYPPPAGTSATIPGLEFAGIVAAVGKGVERFAEGDRVFGIVSGESQAEYLTVDAGCVAAVPGNLTLVEAAAVPEVFVTAYDSVSTQARLKEGETLLVHAVGSGVGLAALQLAKANGNTVIGTSRTPEKLARCAEFGIDHTIEAGNAVFADKVLSLTGGKGADVILDLVGGAYFPENLKAVSSKGRIMVVGLTGGSRSDIDLGLMLRKRVSVIGTTLRGRDHTEKAAAVAEFETSVVPLLAAGRIAPNVERVFAFDDVVDAYEYLASNTSFGKVVLEWAAGNS